MNDLPARACLHCGATFTPVSHNARYCPPPARCAALASTRNTARARARRIAHYAERCAGRADHGMTHTRIKAV